MPRWISTYSIDALTNSTSMPLPVVLTIRPRCSVDLGIDQFLAMGLELAKRAFLISVHQPAI
jgi:hypothetical protein